jgi:hypothetical protein
MIFKITRTCFCCGGKPELVKCTDRRFVSTPFSQPKIYRCAKANCFSITGFYDWLGAKDFIKSEGGHILCGKDILYIQDYLFFTKFKIPSINYSFEAPYIERWSWKWTDQVVSVISFHHSLSSLNLRSVKQS